MAKTLKLAPPAAPPAKQGREHLSVAVATGSEQTQSQDAILAALSLAVERRHDGLYKAMNPGAAEREGAADSVRALSLTSELAPKDVLEGMLCSQMVAVHLAAMSELGSARGTALTAEGRSVRLNSAAKLMRVFAQQMETLNRGRGKGPSEQRVVVEHVHVHDGGQAVVGNVAASPKNRDGGEDKNV